MPDSIITYIILILAIGLGLGLGLTLIIIKKRLPAIKKPSKDKKNFNYYKIDLAQQNVTLITYQELEENTNNLFDRDFVLIRLDNLWSFINGKSDLPEKVFVVVIDDQYAYAVNNALPVLRNKQIKVIIFIPIFIVANNNKYRHIQTQLREYHFQ